MHGRNRTLVIALVALSFIQTVAPADAARTTAPTVELTNSACTFTLTARWDRSDVRAVTLHLTRSSRSSTSTNAVLVEVPTGSRSASATWPRGASPTASTFSGQANLYDAPPPSGRFLGTASTTRSVRASCELTGN